MSSLNKKSIYDLKYKKKQLGNGIKPGKQDDTTDTPNFILIDNSVVKEPFWEAGSDKLYNCLVVYSTSKYRRNLLTLTRKTKTEQNKKNYGLAG